MGEAGFYATSLARILCHTDALNGISAGAVGCMKSNLAQGGGEKGFVHPVFLNDTVNETENETENETVLISQLSKRQQIILRTVAENDRITERQMMQKFSVSRATITRATTALKKMGIIIRVGSNRKGSWMIVKKVIGL